MSYHVYVARDGFKETPIPYEQWIAAAVKCDELFVEEKKNRKGWISSTVNLKADKKQRLSLTPYGLVHAQNPNKDLVAVMFKLAGLLDAKVYSEELELYESVDDWEKRTRNYREALSAGKKKYARDWHKRKLFWLMVIAIAVIIGFLWEL